MRCYAKIDLKKLVDNVNNIIHKVGLDKVIAVVKANAYGHGAKEVFNSLKNIGIKNFAVATIEEALELNEIDSNVNIIILGEIEEFNFKLIENTNIIITISSEEKLRYILENNLKNKIHIKLDTGMNRLGFKPNKINLIDKYLDKLNIEGIFTHLSSVDSDIKYTEQQIKKFQEVTKKYKLKKHILNSAGVNRYYNDKNIVLDYVRVGIDMYNDVMSLYSRVCHIHKVEVDEYIGYNKTYLAKKGSYIATISIGYADGYKRNFSNKVDVIICNKRYRQVGNICMDLIMVEVDDSIEVGDEVVLFNRELKIKELAASIESIDYEIMTTISSRVPKIYEK